MNIPAELYVRQTGIRGVAPKILSPELSAAFALGYSKILPAGPIVTSRDSRATGKEIKKKVIEALTADGREVWDGDLIPLPTTQTIINETKAVGGIDITASHNPPEYNGMKILRDDGTFISKEQLDTITDFVKNFKGQKNSKSKKGEVTDINKKARDKHIALVKAKAVRGKKKLTVAVDAVNGAASFVMPDFLQQINCQTIELASDPEKPFPRMPEPIPENLVWTQERLKGKDYDLCIVVDPDADRIVFIDERGKVVSEALTAPLVFAAALREAKRQKKPLGPIVINLSTTLAVDEIAAKYGVPVLRTPVGETFVVERMKKEKAFFGGEGSSGVIDPDIHYGRDSLVGAVNVINLVRRSGKPLSQLVSELPSYELERIKFPIAGIDLDKMYKKLKAELSAPEENREDGLHLSWPKEKKWIHIRPSNTEPIARIFAEAKTKSEVRELMKKAEQIMKE